jgi:hypothetical protein
MAAAACEDPVPGVRVELHAPADPGARPDWLWIYWLGPRGLLLEARVPERGSLPAAGDRLASVFVGTHGALAEPRLLAVRGQRGDRVACGGTVRVDPGMQAPAALTLGPPLADRDGDGVPDRCPLAGGGPCSPAVDGAAADGGGDRVPAGDAPPPADAGAPPADSAPSGDAPAPGRPDGAADAPGPPPASELRVGLVAHWRFEEGTGSIARDSSGNNNLAMLLGAAATSGWTSEGRVGGGFDMPPADGSGGLVLPTTSVAAIEGALTIAAWTFRTSNRGGTRLSTVLSRRAPNSLDQDYFALAFAGDGRARGSINTELGAPAVTSADPVPLQRWVHVALTYDGASLRLFVDGVPAGAAAYAGIIGNATTPLCLGCAHNRPGHIDIDESLAGRLDELLLYARALPVQEIARLAAGEIPPPP